MENEPIIPVLQKWVACVNLSVDGISLHRELEFITEAECDQFIASSEHDYEKIPVYRG